MTTHCMLVGIEVAQVCPHYSLITFVIICVYYFMIKHYSLVTVCHLHFAPLTI